MLVTITNLTTDPVFISTAYSIIAGSGTLTISRTMTDLDRDSQLKDLILAGTVSLSLAQEAEDTVSPLDLKMQNTLAWANPAYYHQQQDADVVTNLLAAAVLSGGATQAQANARAELLRANLLDHMAGIGSAFVAGEHRAAETAISSTLSAIPALISSSLLSACITLVNGLKVTVVAHGNSSGKHFHDDTTTSGSAFSYTSGGADPPVTLGDVINDLNDIRQAMLTHTNNGSFLT